MKHTINWGILGLGKIAHKFAHDLILVPDAILHAVGSRSQQKAADFAEKYGAHQFYNSYEDLANDTSIDIIYIATPHSFHYEHTLLCLNAGKSVLCEKPIAMNHSEAEEMISLAREKGLFLMEGIWTRFIPATQKVLDLVNSNVIGDLIHMRSDFGFKVSAPPESRLLDPKLGGGALLDIGIYPLYLSMLLMGEPEELTANALIDEIGIDTFTTVTGKFPDNTMAVMEATFLSNSPTEAFIYGTKGCIHMKTPFHHCEQLEITRYPSTESETILLPIEGNGYVHEIEHVMECLKNGKTESDLLPLQGSLSLIRQLDKVRKLIGLDYD